MLKFENVPYRRWRLKGEYAPGKLVRTKAGIRVMSVMGKLLKEGRDVEFTQHTPVGSPDRSGATDGEVYDTISLKVLS